MDAEERAELKDNFDYFDRDKNGEIDFEEFCELLAALGSEGPANEHRAGFQIVDTDGNGTISFNEFAVWWLGEDGF